MDKLCEWSVVYVIIVTQWWPVFLGAASAIYATTTHVVSSWWYKSELSHVCIHNAYITYIHLTLHLHNIYTPLHILCRHDISRNCYKHIFILCYICTIYWWWLVSRSWYISWRWDVESLYTISISAWFSCFLRNQGSWRENCAGYASQKNTSKIEMYKLNRSNKLTTSLFSATNKVCLQWQKLWSFWRALRKRSPLWKVWMATALTDCSGTACIVAAGPDFQHLQVGFSPSASRICSFCEPWFALLKVGFVPFSWFPPFGSGRQNWTGRRQNAVTNRPETNPWQPGEYFYHFQLNIKSHQRLVTDNAVSGCYILVCHFRLKV